MTKIYLVRYGAYSDQGISGAFSTKENAQRYCDIRNEIEKYEDYWVDEYELDKYSYAPSTEVVTYYCARIQIEDDKWTEAGTIYSREEEKDIFTEPVVVEYYHDTIEVKCTESMEKAEKIAIEKYQIYTQQKLENGEM